MPRSLLLFLLVPFLAWSSDPARACTLAAPIEHQLDPDEQQVDTSPPEQVPLPAYSIGRGQGDQFSCSYNTCDQFGTLTLEIIAPSDDRTGPGEMGYRIEYLDGNMPAGLLTGYDVRADDGAVYLHWPDEATDNQEAFYYRLSIRAVDLAGNLSETATELEIHHPGSCGCSAQRFGPTELMLICAALALWILRRKS